ncbi:MAG: hypothetical protein Q9172_002102, partial [Xanthocarpia lactea]
MTYTDWYEAVRPKVDGTWNLHNALLSSTTHRPPLDFFIMFSSTSGIMGQYGQANYAAANSFLDAFAQYRRSLGLAASVIDLGVMEDIGFVAESASLIDYFKQLSANLLSEEDMLEAVRLAIARSFPSTAGNKVQGRGYSNTSQIGTGVLSQLPLSDSSNRIIWKRDRRFAVYRTIESAASASGSSTEGLRSFLAQLAASSSHQQAGSTDGAIEFIAREIGNTLYGFMMKNAEDMELDLPLAGLGLDSLVGIELRNWCRQQLG